MSPTGHESAQGAVFFVRSRERRGAQGHFHRIGVLTFVDDVSIQGRETHFQEAGYLRVERKFGGHTLEAVCLIVVLSFIITYGSAVRGAVVTAIDSHLVVRCHTVPEYQALAVRIVSCLVAFHLFLIAEDITYAHQVRVVNAGVGIRIGVVGGPFL